MKHLVRVVAVLGIAAIPAAAQAQPSVGVRAGVNLATLTPHPDPVVDLERATGFVVGAFVALPVNNVLGFQPEALYSRQGTKLDGASTSIRTKLDYLQFPLLARVRIGMRSPLAVLVGPSLGVRTRTSYDVTGTLDFFPDAATTFRRFDLGIATGAALDVGKVVVDGRYTWGVRNIHDPTFDPVKQKNRVFSLSAGLRF